MLARTVGLWFTSMERKTKIVATLGPATTSEEAITELIERGMNVARLNFSHGTHEDHEQRFRTVREIADRLDRPVAIMGDIQGPKIRVGEFPDGRVVLEQGATVQLLPGSGTGDATHIYVAYLEDVAMEPDGKILLADGLIELTACVLFGFGLCW